MLKFVVDAMFTGAFTVKFAVLPASTAPCPYSTARPPVPVTVIVALTLALRWAWIVRVFADQLTVSFTNTSPLVPLAPVPDWMVTLPPLRFVVSVAPSMSPPLAATVKSVGSSSHVPASPLAAEVFTRVLASIFNVLALVSTKPPLPESLPPRALRLPLTVVRLSGFARSAITTTSPPSPFAPASAWMLPLCSMVLLATRRTVPPSVVMPFASMAPELTTRPKRPWADCADRITVPASAWIRCRFSTSVSILARSTCTPTRSLPAMLRVTASPAASAAVPCRATMTPSLRTSGASRATYLPSSSPWLSTLPVAPLRSKRWLPSRKSLSRMSSVEATRPPTSTRAPGPKTTPLGLTRNTWPLADSEP